MHLSKIKKLFLAFLVLSSGLSLATTFNEQPFPESVKETPVVVRGRVGMSYTNYSIGNDGTKRIYTFYELKVAEIFKAPKNFAPARIIMREIGGEKDGTGLEIAGTAKFERGEDVVVFLGETNPDGSMDVQGMMMGKYDIEKTPDGKEVLRGAGVEGHAAMHHGGMQLPEEEKEEHHDTSPPKRWTLDSLRQLIKSQGDAPSVAFPVAEKPTQAPKNTEEIQMGESVPASDAAVPAPTESAAPQLQTSEDGGSGIPWGYLFSAIGLVVGVLIWTWGRKRQGR